MSDKDYSKQKKEKINEIEFSKVKAIVDIAMKSVAFSEYTVKTHTTYQPFHTLFFSRKIAAELFIKFRQSLTLVVLIDKIENDIEHDIKRINELCQKIPVAYNAVSKESDEMKAREICNSIVLPTDFVICYDLFYKESPNREMIINSDDFYYIGGSTNISKRLVTQKEFLDVTGKNMSTFPLLSDPIDYIDFISVLEYCNALSRIECREPFYALNGETDEREWRDMLLNDTGTAFYCNPNANGFRLPREIELNCIKERDTRYSEYLGEFQKDKFSANCAFAKGIKREYIDYENGEEGLSFRLAYFD